jgi:outer membrane protein TolC
MPRAAKKKSEKTPTPRLKRTRRANHTSKTSVSDVEISRLAYQIYEARGRTGGSPLDDWLQAEQQLTSRD